MNDLTATPNARPYHHGNLREAMVQSALALLEADGPGELSLRRAARDIGVSQTAPLYHFGNKLGLLVAVAIEGFHLLVALRKERIASASTAEERLRTAMLAYVEFGIAHPALFRLMLGPEVRNKVRDAGLEEAAGEAFGMLSDCVSAYLHQHGLTSADDIQRATLAAWATNHGIVTLLLDRQDSPLVASRRPPQDVAEGIVDVLIAGLGAMGTTEPKRGFSR